MKKVIGILGVAVLAVTLFVNSNKISNNDTSLASLFAMNTANAETSAFLCEYTANWADRCSHNGNTIANCKWGVTTCGY